jgi:hypothetical protein
MIPDVVDPEAADPALEEELEVEVLADVMEELPDSGQAAAWGRSTFTLRIKLVRTHQIGLKGLGQTLCIYQSHIGLSLSFTFSHNSLVQRMNIALTFLLLSGTILAHTARDGGNPILAGADADEVD